MGDLTELTGIVLSAMPVGEYDRRVVLLTKERGKVSAFAKGARRPNSPLIGITRAFVFGTFQVYEGRTSYTIRQANISNYFEKVITDLDAVCYACYFAELADYYGRENLDASVMINLLYAALRALTNEHIPKKLVRAVYELRLIAINGESPDFFLCHGCGKTEALNTYCAAENAVYCAACHGSAKAGVLLDASAVYTLQYIVASPLEKLFTFTVSAAVLTQLCSVAKKVREKTIDKVMKSEELLMERASYDKS